MSEQQRQETHVHTTPKGIDEEVSLLRSSQWAILTEKSPAVLLETSLLES